MNTEIAAMGRYPEIHHQSPQRRGTSRLTAAGVLLIASTILCGCSENWARLDANSDPSAFTATPGLLTKSKPFTGPLGLALQYNYTNKCDPNYFRNKYACPSDPTRIATTSCANGQTTPTAQTALTTQTTQTAQTTSTTQTTQANQTTEQTSGNTATTCAGTQKAVRNSILFELMSIVDEDFAEYQKAVRSDRAYKDTLVTITSLALTGTAAAVGGGAAATLAAIDTGIKGANAAIDKNAFNDTAPNILLNQMQTDRDNIAAIIYAGMSKSTAVYTLEEGLRDVGNYYRAGSVTAAVIALANKTAADSATAKDLAADAKALLR